MRKFIFPLLLVFIVFSVFAQDIYISRIPIYFAEIAGTFPSSWYRAPIAAETEALVSLTEQRRSISMLEKAFSKYPQVVLDENLSKVFVFKSLSFYNLNYGGSYYRDQVYLTNNGSRNGYTDFYLEKSFHHEFSSILLQKYGSDDLEEKWSDVNIEGFEYGDGGIAALRENRTGLSGSEYYYTNGFLNEYSTSGFEEDFNELFGHYLTDYLKLEGLAQKYQILDQKITILKDFLRQIEKQWLSLLRRVE